MLNKVIHPHSFNFDYPVSQIVDTFSKGIDKGWMSKRAAMFDDVKTDLKPEKGKTLVHLISTGSGETYGSNNNADYFNKCAYEWEFPHPERGMTKKAMLDGGLEKYHNTFMKRGYVYKHHENNKDPKFASGMIKCEAYNPKMERGELIVALDNDKWTDELEKMSKEEPVYWSIGCCVPTDGCSVCGHRRKTKSESCSHVRDNLLQMTKEGHQVFALNDTPLFHDISGVFRPADKIAFALRTLDKAASEKTVVSSIDLAEAEGFYLPTSYTDRYVLGRSFDRLTTLKKLASMEEEIEKATDESPIGMMKEAFCIGSGFDEIDPRTITKLAMNIEDSLGGMSKASVALPPETFFKVALGNRYGEVEAHMPSVRTKMPVLFREILASSDLDEFITDGTYDGKPCLLRNIKEEISKLAESHSLAPEAVRRRLTMSSLNGTGPRPSGAPLQKTASGKADILAREYGKYLLSFVKDKGEDIQKLSCVMKVS
jgi:hypothetical protein